MSENGKLLFVAMSLAILGYGAALVTQRGSSPERIEEPTRR